VHHFLPLYAPDYNETERLWRELHANVTRNHRQRTIGDPMAAAHRFLRKHTQCGKLSKRNAAWAVNDMDDPLCKLPVTWLPSPSGGSLGKSTLTVARRGDSLQRIPCRLANIVLSISQCSFDRGHSTSRMTTHLSQNGYGGCP